MRSALSFALVALMAVSAVATAPTAAAATSDRSPTADGSPTATGTATAASATAVNASDAASNHDACAALASDPRENPSTDRLGWENGCWANETISVTRGDGLNETELDAVVGRSMARVEAVRQLEFDRDVPVEVISRQTYRERRSGNDGTNTTTANRLHQNVKWEATFSVGENEDALSAFQSTRTATIGGFYNFAQDRIVIVSENTSSPKMDEITLSQELFHALQDQKLRVSYDNRSTREGHNAALGIVEGDGNLVDRFYEQRCDSEWDCLMPESSGGGGGSTDINYGIYLTQFQPYSDGPKFVRGIYNEGGWDAVDAVYETPPTSTEQVIHPEKYPDEGPAEISVTDTSSEEWSIPDMGNGSVDYARFGQAGLSAMFMRPVFASRGQATPVVGPRDFYNLTAGGEISSFDPLNYGLEVTDGWGNDRLYPYVTDESATTNETGYVWKTVWDNGSEASEFVDGYTNLIDYYGAQPVDGRANTYRIPDSSEFGDAFYVNQSGETVVIVNAPTVEQLGEIRDGVATETPSPTDATLTTTELPTDERTETATATVAPTPTDAPTAGEPSATDASGPGFDALAALAGLVAGALVLVAARRRDDR